MGSGFSALAAALVVGARKDYGRQALLPHNAVYVLLGAGLLWFGWFGFNGGSGFSTGNSSVLAFTNTLLDAGLHARRVVRARPDPWPPGDRDRRGDGDHRRLRRHHSCGRFHQPGLGDGARRAGGAAELRGDRLAPADPGRRDARRARRARRRRLHWDPLRRLLRPALVERRRGRPLYGDAGQLGWQALAAVAAPDLCVRGDLRAPEGHGALHAAARDASARRRWAWTSSSTARRPTPPARARSSSRPEAGIEVAVPVANP